MDTTAYLNKIGIKKIEQPSLEFLTELQNHNLLSVPFEDLDIPYRNRIVLDIKKIYDKIIPTKRGGFCYELNGLFHWLLVSLGYKVDMFSARVFNSAKNQFGPEYDHMTLLVHIDNDYLVDVGFGDSFRNPIKMPDGDTEDVGGRYKIFKTSNNRFELTKKNGNEWTPQYSFSTIPRKFSDFTEMCAFQQDSPDSHFRTRMVCTIATQTGRITLSDNSLTITESGIKTKSEIASQKDFYLLLNKYFGIALR